MTTHNAARLAMTRLWVRVSYACLLVYYAIMTMVITPGDKEANPAVWLLYTAPLLLFVPGLIKDTNRTYLWLCLALLLYFLLAVNRLLYPGYTVMAVIETTLVASLFLSAMVHTRRQQKG